MWGLHGSNHFNRRPDDSDKIHWWAPSLQQPAEMAQSVPCPACRSTLTATIAKAKQVTTRFRPQTSWNFSKHNQSDGWSDGRASEQREVFCMNLIFFLLRTIHILPQEIPRWPTLQAHDVQQGFLQKRRCSKSILNSTTTTKKQAAACQAREDNSGRVWKLWIQVKMRCLLQDFSG